MIILCEASFRHLVRAATREIFQTLRFNRASSQSEFVRGAPQPHIIGPPGILGLFLSGSK